MLETKAELVARLLSEAEAAERHGKHLLNLSALFRYATQYDEANALLNKAAELRERIWKIEKGETP
jgi:hypothetical protein